MPFAHHVKIHTTLKGRCLPLTDRDDWRFDFRLSIKCGARDRVFIIPKSNVIGSVEVCVQYFSVNGIIPTSFTLAVVKTSVVKLAGVVRTNDFHSLTESECLVGQYDFECEKWDLG